MLTTDRHRKIFHRFFSCLLAFAFLFVPITASSWEVGTFETEFIIPNTERYLIAEIYYPTDHRPIKNHPIDQGIWVRGSYTRNATISNRVSSYPLIILSHGWHGDRFGHSWLAEALVKEGYIVAAIEHTHDTNYDSSDAFLYANMWQRPKDLSALLDHLLQHPRFEKTIDPSKIGAIGFSLGGLSVLWLSDIKASPDLFQQAMARYQRDDVWPQSTQEKMSQIDWRQAEQSYYDPRIKAIISLAPDLGQGFSEKGLQQAKTPALIIIGDRDSITPQKDNAAHYAAHMPQTSLITLNEAHHFTFMNSCSQLGESITPHLCGQESLETRKNLHLEIFSHILNFLDSLISDR